MNLFHKTTQVVLRSEEQRDEYIEKLQKAHVDYRVFEDQETVYSGTSALSSASMRPI